VDPDSPVAEPEAPPPLSLVERLIGIFHRPVAVMRDLRERPGVFPVLLVTLVVVNVILGLGFGTFIDGMIDQLYENGGIPPEDVDSLVAAIDDNPVAAQTFYHVVMSMGLVLTVFVWAGLFHLSASTFFQPPVNRDAPGFQHSLSQILYANLVNIPGAALVQLVAAARSEPVSGFSLALLLGLPPDSVWHVAADWVSPFNFWWIGLLGVACAVNYRVPLGRALVVPVGGSIVFRVIQMLLAAAGLAAS